MLDQPYAGRSRSLSVTDLDVDCRKRLAGLEPSDVTRIVALKDIVPRRIDDYIQEFFRHLSKAGAASALMARLDAIEEAKRLKREHVMAMVEGDYGREYVEQRIVLGMLYSKFGLETRAFLGAFNCLIAIIEADIVARFGGDQNDVLQKIVSLQKLASFDAGIIADVLIAERERTIGLQQEAILELSTPVLQLRDRLVVLPIIGTIDSQRAKQLTDGLLRAIRVNRSKVAVMDVTGVAAVDSKVANHLIQTVAAARLMGSLVIITGLSAEVAQALVGLGVDLGKINTMADLQAGLEEAERILGYRLVRAEETSMQLQS